MADAAPISNGPTPLQLTIHPLPQKTQGTFLSGSNNTPTFKDLLDTINPLQHIPVVSNIYQAITGDRPSTGATLAGDTLFGGALGFATSLFNIILKNATGADLEGNIMAAIEGKPVPALKNSNTTQITENGPLNYMSANQRQNYNAYIQASMLA